MTSPLHVLIIEDTESDAMLALRHIEKAGFKPFSQRVETGPEMQAALDESEWDIIISDYSLPSFDAPSALQILLDSGKDIPFIVVSGTISEETAIQLLRSGAADYLMKDRLARLGPLIKREMNIAQVRRERNETQAELQKSQQWSNLIYNTTSDAMYLLAVEPGPVFRFLTVNAAYFRNFGLNKAQVGGKLAEEVLSPHTAAFVIAKLKEAVQAGHAIHYEESIDTRRGSLMVDTTLTPIFEQEGVCTHLLGSSHDVSAQKRIEESLRTSEAKFSTIFRESPDAITISRLVDGLYVEINEGFKTLLGYTQAEILGKTSLGINIWKNPQDRDCMIQALMDKGAVSNLEVNFRCKDGTIKNCRVTARLTEINGEKHILSITRDMAAHNLASSAEYQGALSTEKLEPRHDLFSQFIRHSPIYTYIKEVTPTESITLQASDNFQEMIGISSSDMLGKNMFELFPADLAAKITADDWTVVSSGVVMKVEEELNGHCYTTIKYPLLFEGKTYLAGYSLDITERINAEKQYQADQIELRRLLSDTELSRQSLLSLVEDQKEADEQILRLNSQLEQRVNVRTAQLAAANKELEAFAYSVSHDLRAPLRTLKGFSTALLEDYYEQLDKNAQHYLNRIQAASRRMEQLINDLLNLSRVTRSELRYQPIDLSALAQSITDELIAAAPERMVNVVISEHMIVEGDANLIKIALENLLNNAFKFTGQCDLAIILVGVEQQAGEKVYFVHDNGVGFNMEYANKLFAPFQRLHSANEFPGSGIGLSIVQRIISRHGGRIWPESQAGQGTTFYFTLNGA